jgi:nitroreductase
MDFTEVVRRRRMVRRFDPDAPVAPEDVQALLRHAIRAPSAGFSQGWDFVVLSGDDERRRFWDATSDPHEEPDSWLAGIQTAPVLIVCLSDPETYLDRYAEPDKGWTDRDEARWPVPYWDVDTGMAALLMLLTAVDRDLAGLFFGVPPEHHHDLHEALQIPTDRHIVGVVAVGHPAPDRPSPSLKRGRRPVAQVAHRGRFGVPWE